VTSLDGTIAAEVISLPGYFAGDATTPPLEQLMDELGLQRGAEVTESSVVNMLEQIAYESPGGKRSTPPAIREVAQSIATEPLVVLEQSPAFGRSLAAVLSQAGPGYILIVDGKPFLAIAVEGALVVVWFIAGPIQGARAGLTEAARDATRVVATEVFERWLRKRFPRRRS
jgi:hypothetical protein